uniref:Uncharacterized protein n=1 Tax=Oryza sativa subsp. japonica TaxID=39947 RepID=Q6ZL68_ORYSJ|nr:hypothetical protein [Oryza sativa Japonica Group]
MLRRPTAATEGRTRSAMACDHDGDLPEWRRRLERRRRTARPAAMTAAHGCTVLGLYRQREAKARVAAGSGGLGGPFIGARGRRRSPTAAGDEKESFRVREERGIRIELKSDDFQSDIDDASKRKKVEEISGILSPQSISSDRERGDGIGWAAAARLG